MEVSAGAIGRYAPDSTVSNKPCASRKPFDFRVFRGLDCRSCQGRSYFASQTTTPSMIVSTTRALSMSEGVIW